MNIFAEASEGEHEFDAFDHVLTRADLWSVYVDDSHFHDTGSAVMEDDFSVPGGVLWAAVLVPPHQALELNLAICEELLHPIAARYNVPEVHFGDVYQGRGPYSGVAYDERVEIVSSAADLLDRFDVKIFGRRFGPHLPISAPGDPVYFGTREERNVFALSQTVHAVAETIMQTRRDANERAVLWIDEWMDHGDPRAGRKLTDLDDPFFEGTIYLMSSVVIHGLQLADFVATSLTFPIKRVESGKPLFPLHEQALRVGHHLIRRNTEIEVEVQRLPGGGWQPISRKRRDLP